jgi:hypothetical protein
MLQKLKDFYQDHNETFDGISHFISTNYVAKDFGEGNDAKAGDLSPSVNPLQLPSSVLYIPSGKGMDSTEP